MLNSSACAARVVLRVPAMDCPEELGLIERRLEHLEGIGPLHADYVQRRLHVSYDPEHLEVDQITQSIRALGFTVEQASAAPDAPTAAWQWPEPAVWIGGCLLAPALLAWTWLGEGLLVQALAVAATLSAGIPVARRAWRAVGLRAIDMNVLMCVAAIGALATGYALEAATAMFLFGISLWLEAMSLDRARRAVQTLLNVVPQIAHRLVDGHPVDVAPGELEVGDLVLVKPGERVPVDGLIESGRSAVNEAPITGESLPVDKSPGDRVFAGSLNGDGSLEVVAQRTAEETTLAHIARLVEQAHSRRSPTERFVDRFARRYTPAVIALAAVIALLPPLVWGGWGEWFHRSLVLLVIACPCALVISTPVTIVCGLHRAARSGMLVKGGEHLESAGLVNAVAFDKTGTLTAGRPVVVAVLPEPGIDADELLCVAASLERTSEHPLATAIVAAAQQRGIALRPVGDFSAVRGLGVRGVVDGRPTLAGSESFYRKEALGAPAPSDQPMATAGDGSAATTVFVGTPDSLLGRLLLADRPRADARQAVAMLGELGVESVVMLTGDRREVAGQLALELSIPEVYAELLPEDKVEHVERLVERYPALAMVGDGVNDAPALAASRLGIALGTAASDTALETADVVIMTPHVTRVPELIALGQRTRWVLYQNIGFALGVKLAVLVLAALGLATMWMAVAADVGASLAVVFNGMRLLDERP